MEFPGGCPLGLAGRRVVRLFSPVRTPPGEGEYSTTHRVRIKPLMTTSGEIGEKKSGYPKRHRSGRVTVRRHILIFAVERLTGSLCC